MSEFKFHKGYVTGLEWCPYEGSMLISSASDNQVAVRAPLRARAALTFIHVESGARVRVDARERLRVRRGCAEQVWDLALERDAEEEAALAPAGNAAAPEDMPAQLLFLHAGQRNRKECHWHAQIPGMVASTAEDTINVFKPSNL